MPHKPSEAREQGKEDPTIADPRTKESRSLPRHNIDKLAVRAISGVCGVLHDAGQPDGDVSPPARMSSPTQHCPERRETHMQMLLRQIEPLTFSPNPVVSASSLKFGGPSHSSSYAEQLVGL